MSMIMRLRLRTRDVHEVQQEEAIETLQYQDTNLDELLMVSSSRNFSTSIP